MKRSAKQLARKPIKRKPWKPDENDFSDEVKAEVRRRSGDRCEMPGCKVSPIQHFHHRKLKKQGGPGTVHNCMGLCAAHHQWVHANPKVSYEHGWLLHSWGA